MTIDASSEIVVVVDNMTQEGIKILKNDSSMTLSMVWWLEQINFQPEKRVRLVYLSYEMCIRDSLLSIIDWCLFSWLFFQL